MNEERLGSAAAFAEQLAAHLGSVAVGKVPAARDLADLVEMAFFASLHEEEARRSEPTLATPAVEVATP